MLEWLFDKVLKPLLDRLLKWLSDRYYPQHVREGLSGDRRSLAQRLWSYNKSHIFGVDGFVVLSLPTLWLLYLQLKGIYDIIYKCNLSLELRFPPLLRNWSPYPLQIPVFTILFLMIIVFLIAILRRTLSKRKIAYLAATTIAFLVINASFAHIERWLIISRGAPEVLEQIEQYFEGQAFEALPSAEADQAYLIAERVLNNMAQGHLLPGGDSTTWAYLSRADYQRKQFERSIENACLALSIGSGNTLASETLHESIYYLAQTKSREYADTYTEEIRTRYGGACASEASPYWLAISPYLIEAFRDDTFQKHSPWWKSIPYPQDLTWEEGEQFQQGRYKQDIEYLEYLLQRYPDEAYLDYALFFLGRHRDIVTYHRDSPLFDEAYYAWGLQAFESRDYQEAIRRYNGFLDQFRTHEWRNDALWRIAKAHFALKDYLQALRYLTLAKNEERADGVVYKVDVYGDIAYILDVMLDEEELERYAQLNTDPEVDLLIQFTRAHRHLLAEEYNQAYTLYEELAAPYPDLDVYSYDKDANIEERLASLSLRKMEIIKSIEDIKTRSSPPEALFMLAKFYLMNPYVFRNRMLSDVSLAEIELPPDYFMARCTDYRAAELLYILVEAYPEYKTPEVIQQMAESYDIAAANATLIDPGTIKEIRLKAVEGYRWLLTQYPEDSTEFDETFEAVGAVYLHRPMFDKEPWLYTEADMQGLQREYLALAQAYPNHHLANNALNWVAWSYCYLANMHAFSPDVDQPDWAKYEQNYQEALVVYRQLSQMDPLSGITQNANEAIEAIEEKLANPDKRVPVPLERWSW